MANGYDDISLAATKLNEAAKTKMPTAVRDRRFTKQGIGFRTQEEAVTSSDYPGGIAKRKRGMNERELPWETAQEATARQIRPREALEPSGLKEDGWDGDCFFPSEGDARAALAVMSQFVDGPTLTKLQDQIEDQYGDPMDTPPVAAEPEWDGPEGSYGWVDEAAYFAGTGLLFEATPKKGGKGGGLDFTAFVFAGGKRYAIDTPANAQKALAQIRKSGKDGDVARVEKAVKKRYPKMDIEQA